jgi:hypothetical protein
MRIIAMGNQEVYRQYWFEIMVEIFIEIIYVSEDVFYVKWESSKVDNLN